MAARTKAERRGLVTTIIVAAPMKSTELRNAIETEAPTAALIWVVSAVSRDKFPCFRFVEISERKRNQVPEYALAQIGDDALTQRGDEIETRGARQREHRHDD